MQERGWVKKAIIERGLDTMLLSSIRPELLEQPDVLEMVVAEDTSIGDVDDILQYRKR